MGKTTVFDMLGNKIGEIELPDTIFGAESRPNLYFDVVRAQLLSRRRGTVMTKTRAMVAGSTRKVFKQKSTGRARKGDSRSPIYRRGGVVFGPEPRDWEIRLPKKVRRLALLSAMSDRVREGHVVVVDGMPLEVAKTRKVVDFLTTFKMASALIVDVDNRSLSLSCRNLPNAKYLASKGLNLFDVLKYEHLVLTRGAVEAIEGALKS